MADFIKVDKFTDQTTIAADERRDHYDICNEQILEMGIDDLKTVYNSGKENADRILIRSIYLEPMCIAVYPSDNQ